MKKKKIKTAYKLAGKTSFYDGMITCSTVLGKAICSLVWNMNESKNNEYIKYVLDCIPKDFSGKLLEVPVGTGVLTMPTYRTLNRADITCIDYSPDMLSNAKARGKDIRNIEFATGDVGNLLFDDEEFDIVMSLNGVHAFPDKETAFSEIYRVLKPQGVFCGCFYIEGENRRTDFFVNKLYKPMGYFTPPFYTKDEVYNTLMTMYQTVKLTTFESIVCFKCVK